MKTQTQINWYAGDQNDWTGIELIDTETGETHATMAIHTPEALALITNAPELFEALRELLAVSLRVDDIAWADAVGEGNGSHALVAKARNVITKVETEAKK